MRKVGLVIDGGDHFVGPIENALRQRYQVTRFVPRFVQMPAVGASVNKMLLYMQLLHFMRCHDVVFFEWSGWLLIKATHMLKVCPIVTRMHSIEVVTAAHLIDWSQVDGTIVVSQHMKRRLLDVSDIPSTSLHVINYGVDLARFRSVPRTWQHRIGMACSVIPLKRVYEAVLCVSELRRQGYPFTLHIAGKLGDDKSPRYPLALVSLIERLGLIGDVTLYGYVDDVARWYQAIDIFLSNSYWEGQQNALLEAMASGCYCLSHCWGGAEEVLPSENIFVTDTDLQAKLLSYAALSGAKKQLAQAGMRAIAEEKFDERQMVQEITDIIERAVTSMGEMNAQG